MSFIQKLANERIAKHAARFMKYACYFAICFCVLCTAASFLGHQTFILHTKTGTFERAVYAEENHSSLSGSMTVHTGDDIHVWTDDNGRIDPIIQAGLSLVYAVHIVPMIFAYWFLSRVFSNINKGDVFTGQNSYYLLYYGALQCWMAVFVPFIKLLICWLVNLVSNSRMSISTGQAMFQMLISGIAFIIAAYIIHYGVHLQDEVDHTL